MTQPFCKYEFLGPYRQKYFSGGGVQGLYKELQQILDQFPTVGALIDFGCGDGAIGVRLAKRGLMVYGIDIDEIGLKYAKEYAVSMKVENQITFEKKSVYDDFSANAFDYGLCTLLMEIIPSPSLGLQLMLSRVKKWILVTFVESRIKDPMANQIWKNKEEVELFLKECNVKFELVFSIPPEDNNSSRQEILKKGPGVERVLYYKIFK